jgi:hypothetical protein
MNDHLPVAAFAIAVRIAQFVKTLVGRAMHVAIVKGLNRKLVSILEPDSS